MILMLAWADVWAQTAYRCEKPDGSIVYTNIREIDSCRSVEAPERFIAPSGAASARQQQRSSAKRSRRSSGGNTATASRSNANRVQSATQLTRDQKRRAILEEELALEQKNLAEAKAQLNAQVAGQKKANTSDTAVKAQQDKVMAHQRNIEALRRELARIPQ